MTGGAFGPPLGFKSQKRPGWLTLNCTKNVPGNKKHNDAVEKARKNYMFGTSLVNGIPKNEFNYHLKTSDANFKGHIAASVNELKHKTQFPVHMNTTHIVILHADTNNISPRRNVERLTKD